MVPSQFATAFPQKAVGARSPNNRHRNSLLVGLTRSPLAGPSSFLGLVYFFARLQTICLARQLKNWIWAKQFSVFHFSSSFTAWLNLWTISTHLAGTSITASCFCSTTQVKPYIQTVKSGRRNQGDSSKLHTPLTLKNLHNVVTKACVFRVCPLRRSTRCERAAHCGRSACCKNKKIDSFATFFRLGTLFHRRKAE